MRDSYCIENDFAAQKEIGERERDVVVNLHSEIANLKAKLSVAEKEASEFKMVLEEIKELYLDAEGPIIDGMEMGQKAYVVLKRLENHVMWPYDEENKNG